MSILHWVYTGSEGEGPKRGPVMALWIKRDGGGGHIGILGVSFCLFLPHSDVTEVFVT